VRASTAQEIRSLGVVGSARSAFVGGPLAKKESAEKQPAKKQPAKEQPTKKQPAKKQPAHKKLSNKKTGKKPSPKPYSLFVKVCMVSYLKNQGITPKTYKDTDIINETWEEMKRNNGKRSPRTRYPSHLFEKLREEGFTSMRQALGQHWKKLREEDASIHEYYVQLVSNYKAPCAEEALHLRG
jgi:hypothetical protein